MTQSIATPALSDLSGAPLGRCLASRKFGTDGLVLKGLSYPFKTLTVFISVACSEIG